MFSVSVVIPTLGGSQLYETIYHLNKGELKPSEILICIPEAEAWKVVNLVDSNVKIIKTSCRGQVAQRAVGFSLVTQDLVLQMDDDILLNEGALKQLVDGLISVGPGNVVAPVLCNLDGECLSRWESSTAFRILKNIHALVICGAQWGVRRMGTISPIGIAYAVDPACCSNQTIKSVDWLPGGCILNYRKDLVLDNFYPFSGKAYCEDLFHSLLRKKKNLQQYLVLNAFAKTAIGELSLDFFSLYADLRARNAIRQQLSGNAGRFFLWSFLEIMRKVYVNLKHHFLA